jgi:hypothetical protein
LGVAVGMDFASEELDARADPAEEIEILEEDAMATTAAPNQPRRRSSSPACPSASARERVP